MRWLHKNKRPERGLTLVEIMVTVAITAVTSGLILGVMVHMRRATIKSQARVAMQSAAEEKISQIASVLQAAAAPSALDAPLPNAPVFKADKCTVIHSKQLDTKGLQWVDVRTAVTEKGKTIQIHYAPIEKHPADPPAQSAPAAVDARFSVSATFQYAARVGAADLEPEFVNQLPPGEYPQLIRVRVVVEDLKGELKPFEITTAVRTL